MNSELSIRPQPIAALERFVKSYKDFPRPGVLFQDLTPIYAEPDAFRELVGSLGVQVKEAGAQCVAGLEARGFIVGVAVAQRLGLPFIPLRKPGKLPGEVFEVEYELEYGKDRLQMQKGVLEPGKKVAIVDDLLATGGTAAAAAALIERAGGVVSGLFFAINLPALGGAKRLSRFSVTSVLSF